MTMFHAYIQVHNFDFEDTLLVFSTGFGAVQIFPALAVFMFCEYGNYSIHAALRDLRPIGN